MSMVRSLFLGLPVAALCACGSNSAATREVVAAACTRGVLEADITYAMPLSGPGVDPATGKLAAPPVTGYAVSTTYLALKGDRASGARFEELLGPVVGELQHQPGLRAIQVTNSAKCGTARTLTVWQDEDAMWAFVKGAAHGKASDGITEVSRGGSAVAHWHASTLAEATWAYSAQRLSTTPAEF